MRNSMFMAAMNLLYQPLLLLVLLHRLHSLHQLLHALLQGPSDAGADAD